MGKLFGTDGIRGIANSAPMTVDMALKVGQAVGYLFRRRGNHSRILIGKDTRLSGYMLENAIASGINSMGTDVIFVGPMPTPGIAFITENMDADCGIVISASHNPFADNGIKIFTPEGLKLTDDQEQEMEELISSSRLSTLLSPPEEIGRAWREEDALGRYIVFLKHTFPRYMNLKGFKIVMDCANGATYKVAPTLFREMRAETVNMNVNPNGENINLNCGTLHPENLVKKVIQENADIGLAFDGDGDRVIAIDEKGGILTGDQMLAICAKRMKDEGTLANDLVVSTVMSNIGFIRALEEIGIRNVQSQVGDRYVLEEMRKNGAVLGGEDSGHIIFAQHHTTGDGILTALQLLAVIKKEDKPLSELKKIMKVYPQILINIDVSEKPPLDTVPEIQNIIKEVESELGDNGRVLVRYSGTQNMCRVMVEGPTEDTTKVLAQKIADVVSTRLR